MNENNTRKHSRIRRLRTKWDCRSHMLPAAYGGNWPSRSISREVHIQFTVGSSELSYSWNDHCQMDSLERTRARGSYALKRCSASLASYLCRCDGTAHEFQFHRSLCGLSSFFFILGFLTHTEVQFLANVVLCGLPVSPVWTISVPTMFMGVCEFRLKPGTFTAPPLPRKWIKYDSIIIVN